MKKLDVYLNEKLVGELEQNTHGEMTFAYDEYWLDKKNAYAISRSLPLKKETFRQKECRPFFAGVLPEDNKRRLIARNLGISDTNDFSMLEKIGGECAGAITLLPKNSKHQPVEHQYKKIAEKNIPALIEKISHQPLLAGEKNIRLSMAGVQDKLPVHIMDGQMSIPFNNSPSTHILKPDNIHFAGLVYNEAYCMNLAKSVGLSVAPVETKEINDQQYLLIERYDRVINNKKIQRLHQEDFCQALGITPERKYQSEGGPSIMAGYELIKNASSIPAVNINHFINAIIFNVLIGNCDAHGKNFSLLYGNGLSFTPLYDLVCTLYYDHLSRKMAMKLGNEYDAIKINLNQFDALAEKLGVSKSALRKQVINLAEKVGTAVEKTACQNDVEKSIAKIILRRCGYVAQ